MNASIEDFGTGWYGIHLRIRESDIDALVEQLLLLKLEPEHHFHAYSTAFDSEPGGVADIAFYRDDQGGDGNMEIGG